MTTTKPTGYLLHEDSRIAVIATLTTENSKTGDMVQVWILSRATNPIDAVKTGADADVCLDCKHRGTGRKDRTCYVNVFQAPYAIWNAYNRGRYPFLSTADFAQVFQGRKIRFGAYGEPVLIPLAIVAELSRVADGHTGYSHQWRNPAYAEYRAHVMASVDSPAEYDAAKSLGWRTFRVRPEDTPLLPREITCPASDESGRRTTCANCKLCSGSYAGDPRKDIAIVIHGANAAKFIQIGA
jgi:hypothetical protein